MSVTFKLQEYRDHIDQVEFVNAIYNGIDTARALIVKKPNEFQEDYNNRVALSTLNNFVERIVTTTSGEIMRKPLTYEDTSKAIINDMDRVSSNQSLDQVTKDLIKNAVKEGIGYLMVDMPKDGGAPYMSLINRGQVTNWRKDVNGIFTLVVIAEMYEVHENRFEVKNKLQYRVIDEVGNIEIWRNENPNGKGVWEIHETIITTYNFCPFYDLEISKTPPLYDIATINASHLNLSSMKDDFLTEALDPQRIFYGCGTGDDDVSGMGDKTDDPKVVFGIRSALFIDDTEARVELLEMSGENYNIASEDLSSKEKSMAERALNFQDESVKNKTATQTAKESSESNSRQSDIAEDAETVINNAINAYTQMKYFKPYTGRVIVNRDFNIVSIDTGLLTGLNSLQVSGNISKKTLLRAMQKAEVIDIENIDDELADIEKETMGIEEVKV